MHIPAEVAKTTCNLKSSFSPQPKLLVTASYGIEPGRRVEYIPLVEKALELSTHKPHKVLIYNRPSMVSYQKPHGTWMPVSLSNWHSFYCLLTVKREGNAVRVVNTNANVVPFLKEYL